MTARFVFLCCELLIRRKRMSIKSKSTKNFTEGPLFFRITLFALPIMLTGILQIAYSMADNIVVGKFSGDQNALAAVGSTSSLTNLIINLLFGIGAGTGIVVSQYYGARDREKVSKSVHTAMLFSILGGIFMCFFGLAVSRPALELLGTKEEVIESATLYLRVICVGIPANSLYNFGAAIMRGTGNSKLPLFILGGAGMCNVLLNLLFVIVCGMSVLGVALATIISQYISAIAVLAVLVNKKDEPFALKLAKLRISKEYLIRILRFGVPAGVASSMFAVSNVILTGAVNTFPTTTVTANTIAMNIDSLTLTSMSCFGQASMTFSGQNCGAGKPERIKKSVIYSVIQVVAVGLFVASLELIFAHGLIGLYLDTAFDDALVVENTAIEIMKLMLSSYVICGLLDTVSGGLKGLGYTMTSMVINLIFICGFRIFWVYAVFPKMNTVTGLYLAYPISWISASVTAIACLVILYRRFKRKLLEENDSVPKKSIKI